MNHVIHLSVKKIIPQILEYVKPAGYSSLTFKKNGFKYDSEISGWGLSATYTSLKPVGKDRIRPLTGAKGADFFVDINVKGKNLGYKGDTKGGWPDFKIRFDFEPEDIVNSGKVK